MLAPVQASGAVARAATRAGAGADFRCGRLHAAFAVCVDKCPDAPAAPHLPPDCVAGARLAGALGRAISAYLAHYTCAVVLRAALQAQVQAAGAARLTELIHFALATDDWANAPVGRPGARRRSRGPGHCPALTTKRAPDRVRHGSGASEQSLSAPRRRQAEGRRYATNDAFAKAIAKIQGLSNFQSCADECAHSFASVGGDSVFKQMGLDDWRDVFYGQAWLVDTDVDRWLAQADWPQRKRRRKGGPPDVAESTLVEHALLRDLAFHAQDFMQAVRALPCFREGWNKRELTSRDGPFLMADGRLNAHELKFTGAPAKAKAILEARPLCAKDMCDVASHLRCVVPATVVRLAMQFAFPARN